MYLIIWEYQVKADRVAEFEGLYSASGAWARLFKRSNGFLETELLRDETEAFRYITIDRWKSSQDFVRFQTNWESEYEELDTLCKDLTEQENLIGMWTAIPSKTR